MRVRASWLPLALGTVLVAKTTIGGIYAKLGHPGATLDDAYIHFQYARAIAEGHPFRYHPGDPVSTGATSLLWPLLLAPFHALGFRGESILWPAWTLSFLALAALAYETYRLARPLAGRAAAIGAGAMSLSFGGLVWCAASGMEVVPFAWVIAHATRRTAEWWEGERTPRKLGALFVCAVAAPLLRPEGSLSAIVIAIVVAVAPLAPRFGERAKAAAFVFAALLPTLVVYALTGSPTSSTAQVKLLAGNPNYVFVDTVLANARLLVGTLLDGEVWSAEFLPRGGAIVACVGLAALVYRGWATRRLVRAALVLLLALSMFVPCTYVTFLWNRLRYLWPFAPGWFVGLACLARVLSALTTRLGLRAGAAGLLSGAVAGTFVVRLDWVIDDVAQSASGIDRQQVALGLWANATLPRDARIGVNDTGAIAYFGERRTFDIVGLTTPSEAGAWVGGVGSRFEHYERLPRKELPTHFIVYPDWMGTDALFGRTLHEAVVTDSTILGGQVMRAIEARWDGLGSGEAPWTPLEVSDAIDVADLESERAHAYEPGLLRDGEELVLEGNAPDGRLLVDGGRTNRVRERFVARSHGALVARVRAASTATFRLAIDDAEVGRVELMPDLWSEISFELPDVERARFTITSDAAFDSFHYWIGTK